MLGLIGEGTGIAAKVLKSMGTSPLPPRRRPPRPTFRRPACALSTVRGVRTVEKRPSVAKKNVILAPRG
jgi:hypothetical protein